MLSRHVRTKQPIKRWLSSGQSTVDSVTVHTSGSVCVKFLARSKRFSVHVFYSAKDQVFPHGRPTKTRYTADLIRSMQSRDIWRKENAARIRIAS